MYVNISNVLVVDVSNVLVLDRCDIHLTYIM